MDPDPTTSPGRGRGRLPDPQRTAHTRQLILEAALATFLQSGFERTRMADVAARAGLAKGTLYLHFADKEALFEFVLQRLVSEPLARLRAGPIAGETPRTSLERLFLPVLRDMETSGRAAVLRLIIAEGARFPELASIHRRLVMDPIMAAVREAAKGGGEACRAKLAGLVRYPQLAGAPVVLAAVWNGLWASEPLDAAALFTAFLDLVFGPAEPNR